MNSSSHNKDIEADYANLSINDEEGLVLNEIPGHNPGLDYTHCLVGSFLTNRRVNF